MWAWPIILSKHYFNIEKIGVVFVPNVCVGMVNMSSGGMSIYSNLTTFSLLAIQWDFMKRGLGEICFRETAHPYGIDRARTELVMWAIGEHPRHDPPCEFDFLLWLDTDMQFPEYILAQLLQYKKPITTALYVNRRPPFHHLAYKEFDTSKIHPETKIPYYKLATKEELVAAQKNNELMEIWGTGFGCVLIDVDIFKKMSRPWFFQEDGQPYGEDMFFFDKLHKEFPHMKVWCDTTLVCQHISQMLIPFDLAGLKYDEHFDMVKFRKIRRDSFER